MAEESFAEFVERSLNEVNRPDVAAQLDQEQAFNASILAQLDLFISLMMLGADRGQSVGSTAAMVRAHRFLSHLTHQQMSTLLLQLMAHCITLKLDASGQTIGERLLDLSVNNGMEVFTRFLHTGGNVCLHCGINVEGGYCQESLDTEESSCTCDYDDDEPV